MSCWKKLFGKNSSRTEVAGTQSNKKLSSEAEQLKKKLASHPENEIFKRAFGDEKYNQVLEGFAEEMKKRKEK